MPERKNPLRALLIFFWEDFKSDIAYIKKVLAIMRGEHESDFKMNKSLGAYFIENIICDMPNIIEANWRLFIFVVWAFILGWACSAKYYQVKCNDFYRENCPIFDVLGNEIVPGWEQVSNLTLNFSKQVLPSESVDEVTDNEKSGDK